MSNHGSDKSDKNKKSDKDKIDPKRSRYNSTGDKQYED